MSGVFNHAYDTDNDGNITQKGVRTYTYDVLERLNAEAGGTATSFTYDAIGNRLTEVAGGTTTYTYPSTNSKLSSVGANSYTYDAMGNVTGDGARTYVWSAARLLKEAKIGGSTVGAYTYSSDNQRTKKVAGGNSIHYVYGHDGLLYGEYNNAGGLIREYVWLNGESLAQIDAGSPEVLTYLHTDDLQTPRYGTNAGGSIVWTWDSGAFGKEVPTGSSTVNLRLPGQYYDSESTLHYNWNRYYNSATGRYVSSDPESIYGHLGAYDYVEQSPVNFIDPLGLLEYEPGFPPVMKPEVERAVSDAKRELESCKGRNCDKGEYCFSDATIDRIIENLDKAKYGYRRYIRAPGGDLACGKTSSALNAEYIYFSEHARRPDARCCGLSETLAHEAQHFGNGVKNRFKDELKSLQLEAKCFDCDMARKIGEDMVEGNKRKPE